MKSFKGFNKDLTCRGFQYKVGETYEEENAKLCETGFHACENPIDCMLYYNPTTSVYHEVELEDVSDENDTDTKRVGKKITIGAKISIPEICRLTFDYVKEHCTNEYNADEGKPATAGYRGAATAGDSGAATAGDSGAATAGDRGAATAGYSGAATAGDFGAATAVYKGAATAGNYGAATAGNYGAATAGYKGAATAGNRGAATAGDYGAATSRGKSATGDNGLSVARGNNVRVKGGIGSVLVIAEENENDCSIKEFSTAIVDGNDIKADTWYKLENGKLVEAYE